MQDIITCNNKLLQVAVTNKNLETQFEIKADKKKDLFS